MERCVSVRLRVAQLLVFSALIWAAHASAEDAVVVLVTGDNSPIESISSLDMRKIYFGISVSIDGSTVRALRRSDDERLNQIFLQSVIAMSQRSYERRLLSLTLKFGTPRPVMVKDRDELLRLLAENPSTIAYMWKDTAEADPRVRIIRVLWQKT
jgi:hypothetical protein